MSSRFYELLLRLSDETKTAYLIFFSVPDHSLKKASENTMLSELLVLCYIIDKYREEETTNPHAITYYENVISRLDILLHGPQTIEVVAKRQVLHKQLANLLL